MCIISLQEQKTSLSSKISTPDLQNTLPSYSMNNGELLTKQQSSHGNEADLPPPSVANIKNVPSFK
jgi:hypothetical protein